jgi:hypothetical protein
MLLCLGSELERGSRFTATTRGMERSSQGADYGRSACSMRAVRLADSPRRLWEKPPSATCTEVSEPADFASAPEISPACETTSRLKNRNLMQGALGLPKRKSSLSRSQVLARLRGCELRGGLVKAFLRRPCFRNPAQPQMPKLPKRALPSAGHADGHKILPFWTTGSHVSCRDFSSLYS